jgi:hypothetical protein
MSEFGSSEKAINGPGIAAEPVRWIDVFNFKLSVSCACGPSLLLSARQEFDLPSPPGIPKPGSPRF